LAHGLRASGIDAVVFERDRTPQDRLQGYRLNISATGNRALADCLPADNYQRFVEASAKSSTQVSFFDEHLRRLLEIRTPQVDRWSVESERPISRIALRKVLLDGIEDDIRFDWKFESYEQLDGRVIATFANGQIAEGDLLVGADGASSKVARQLLPQAHRVDTGLIAISGRFPLDDAARSETPGAVFAGPTLVMGPSGIFMFASAVEYPADAKPLYDHDQYVMWGVSGRKKAFGLRIPPDELSPEQAQALALNILKGWSPSLRRMVERADPSFTTAFTVRSAAEVHPWATQSVTLLGDALHNMTPFRGMGANAALYDAARLRETLAAVRQGAALIPTLSAYECDMIDHGFAAVRSSLGDMNRLHDRSPVTRAVTKAMFRLIDAMPWLQQAFRGRR
jgi:2-polyprenyl-6-methoxyphenol hydroxylase-like FAD-dependent oxidoreductase